MKKTLIATLAALGALTAIAAPAAAQPYGYDRYDRGYDRNYDRSYDEAFARSDRSWTHLGRIALNRVDRAIEAGALNRWEARRLRAEAFDLYQWESRYGGNGLDWRERQIQRQRYESLMARLDDAVNDRDRGGYRYYR
jgi:hypothetical protein